MANVVRPVGLSRNMDIEAEAAQQDRERLLRENAEYSRLTGQAVRSYEAPDPLVSLDRIFGPRDVATDGDSYDENNSVDRLGSIFTTNSYVEDNPTELLESLPRQSSRVRNNNSRISVERDISAKNDKKAKEEEKLKKDIAEKKDNVKDPLSYLEI